MRSRWMRAALALLVLTAATRLVATREAPLAPSIPGPSAVELYRPAPDRLDDSTLELHGSTWVGTGAGFVLRLQLVDDDQRGAYIEHATGLAVDPFASRPDAPARYLNFVLEVENTGETPLAFNPKTCVLMTNRKRDLQSPSGMSDLSFSYRETHRELPAAYAKVGSALFEHPVVLQAGQSAAGLLIYRALHSKTKWLAIEIALSLSSGDVVRLTPTYERVKEGR